MYNIGKIHCFLNVIFNHYFQESLLENVICENCLSGIYQSIKSTFTMSRYLKGPSSVLKILFQRGTYGMTTGEAFKNELKVAITLKRNYKIPSSNDKISYTLLSLINHDGDSLVCGHYVSDFFNSSTEI